jgi:SAM-dependent methyltransferase
VIHASNLLCRLPDPRKFLADVPRLLKAGGVLVLISPHSWLEEYTPRDKWVGGGASTGGEDGGEPQDTFSVLQREMPAAMTLEHTEDVPFLIREHARKFQYGVSHCTVWRKNE